MDIIPVIDIYQGQVVHAVRGQRENYHPINSDISPTSRVFDVINAYLGIFQFNRLYIADLNAIQSRGENLSLIKSLKSYFPDIDFWVDSGISDSDQVRQLDDIDYIPVIGTESNISCKMLEKFKILDIPFILSLDFLKNKLLGNIQILNQTENWPKDIIIMQLARVGSKSGPDVRLFKRIRKTAPDKNFYIAGGIRDQQDLELLEQLNVQGCLISTALHNRNIDKNIIKKNAP